MISYLIIEDEPIAVRRLRRLLLELRPEWKCVGSADSISEGIDLLHNSSYDIIFSDIELSDGSAFEIYQKVQPKTPIIFITAFDQYAIKVFDFNSIHYILKPINTTNLQNALVKFEINPIYFARDGALFSTSREEFAYKLISRVGNRSTVINHFEISYFYYCDRLTTAYLQSGESHILDQSLDALIEYLPSDQFYRINRQCIVSKMVVSGYKVASSHRLSLKLTTPPHTELIVSKDNVRPFKDWLHPD